MNPMLTDCVNDIADDVIRLIKIFAKDEFLAQFKMELKINKKRKDAILCLIIFQK